MRTTLALCLLLSACAERALEYPATPPVTPTAPSCGHIGDSCCFTKAGCDADPRTGLTLFTDCVSPPGETDQGICIEYGSCGNPGNVCCNYAGEPDAAGDFCENEYTCLAGRCVPQS